MKTLINIDNYEEIMFRLVEEDFDAQTTNDLLGQIEKDELFKFEWEAWQKTKFVDPLENYLAESSELTEKIILIAEPEVRGRKRILYYWAAAASIILLIGTLFLLNTDFSSSPKPEVAATIENSPVPVEIVIPTVQNQAAPIAIKDQQQIRNQKKDSKNLPVIDVSSTNVPIKNTLAEIPLLIDSVPTKTNKLAKALEKKPRYTITIETSDIIINSHNYNDLAQNQNGKIKKVFTNTKLLLSRKPNGEPDKIILVGDENSYLCININY